MNSPHPSPEEIFRRLLDESAARLAAPDSAGIAIPDDELHREIIVPLLPAMLVDKTIREHWCEQAATGFPARLARHFDGGEPAPRWLPGDLEIHVTASYSAGADARALADTLLSEESLRDMTAALMNQLLDALWPSLAPAPSAAPAEPQAVIEIPTAEIPAPEIAALVVVEIPEPIIPVETKIEPEPSPVPAPSVEVGPERAAEIHPAEFGAAPQPRSRALIRALCGDLAASPVQRGIAANSAPSDASAAIVARRILCRAGAATSPRRLPRRASL